MSSSSYPRTEQMSVGPDNNQNGNIQEKDWSYKLGDCHDACFLSTKTFICPCVTYGENRSNITKKNNNIICSILYCFFCPCILGALSRYDVRRKYNIKGSLGGDCCTHCFCCCCGLIQESREIENNLNG
ncbi:hypothetical protein RhiirA5_426693 [Rhizophagus irregularis]|uniref:PLAC8-domain-containing protein n=3 Tax=Rhizophagus irregularis TaxID=588596 RepID=A0A2I1F385_9GLOM|nr:hypothetical protein GLOIN_2v1622926 [Rhizophagus irregularis DAOM 181602=DAOM 197198]EXX68937.1 hypothetical protein RirG_100550 [Rhizophagus irregularis DAOM 197198w]PKC01439.1 hypothetical protein RhiirA5_426693 [Rhizophagus irregularis]PKC58902.1 hypothetical protein RhiirA1_470273 [Rhizophagus irregularis]PKY28842.1 hypothetical protein RhiirB3_445212 [Rhizophagus irregularis]PKY55420.1 hypothetical protein RhiirA4_474864 [Rhizophagus irregularis]|eukprot:XP_025176655.1 hypothetical protein GLOIN_2v1622926 [Rhizophagus irregularis DAOM 181602=DAOM 197198]